MTVVIWLGERLRDLLMWPLNLWRDFPVRFGRLRRTCRQGLVGLAHLLPAGFEAAGSGRFRSWLRLTIGQAIGGLHLLLAQLFDLVGGPELAQFWLHLITNTTPLSQAEVALITAIVGPERMRYRDVRVAEGGLMDLIFKLNGNLAFATWHTINLPRSGRHTRANLAVLVHELAHVYQYEQVGSRYLGEAIYMLIKTRRDCYDYGGPAGLQIAAAAGKQYRAYNREQQAKMVEDYFARRQQGLDTAAYEPFIAQLRAGNL